MTEPWAGRMRNNSNIIIVDCSRYGCCIVAEQAGDKLQNIKHWTKLDLVVVWVVWGVG